jgi:hypothetical protein
MKFVVAIVFICTDLKISRTSLESPPQLFGCNALGLKIFQSIFVHGIDTYLYI